MVTSTNHVIARLDLLRARPWHFGDFRNIFLPNIGEDQKKSYDFSSGSLAGTQARSQKFAMGGLFWGSGGGAPSRRRPMGLGAKPPAAGGLGYGGGASSAQNFCIFCKMNLILELF